MAEEKYSPERHSKPRAPTGLAEEAAPPVEAGKRIEWVRIGPGGRLVIPAPMRRALGIREGDHVQVRLEAEELHVVPAPVAHRRIQDLVAKYASSDDRSWVDELIEERKREFEREITGE